MVSRINRRRKLETEPQVRLCEVAFAEVRQKLAILGLRVRLGERSLPRGTDVEQKIERGIFSLFQ